MFNTEPMWLVYVDSGNMKHYQPWQDVVESGTLIDPDTGNDLEVVGWTQQLPS